MGQRIKQDLLAILDQRYPIGEVPSPLQAERMAHAAYAEDRCKAYITNPADIEALDTYINTLPTGDTPNHPLVISGESGLGKSALLAYWLIQYQTRYPDHFVIQHYAGISGDANAISLLRRIMAEIKVRYQETDELPGKPEDIVKDFPMWLARVRQNDPLLLVLDGINQLEADNLNWLPSFWPANVRLILSTLPDQKLDELQARGWPCHFVQPMDAARRSQLIQTYLQTYRKALSAEQTHKIASAPQCGNPLFLRTVLEELRIFGSFEQLDSRIADYTQAANPAELFGKVLTRMEHDYDKTTVASVLSSIWAARRGLSETELLGITSISRLDISIFLLALDYHLARRGGLLNFFHDYLRQAVRQRYLNDEAAIKVQHIKLANYFDQQPLDERKAEELPWQWQQAKEDEKLRDCIADIPMFEVLYDRDKYDLLSYWIGLLDSPIYDPGKSYNESIALWKNSIGNEYGRKATVLNKLGVFLMEEIPRLSIARSMLEEALSLRNQYVSNEPREVAESLNDLALLLNTLGEADKAKDLYYQSVEILESMLGADHLDVAVIRNNLASLLQDKLDFESAEELFRKSLDVAEKNLGSDHPELAVFILNHAQCLSHFAGENYGESYYDEISSMFRRATDICEKAYGSDHPATAVQLGNLASWLLAKGDVDGAEPLFIRQLGINEMTFGKDHPRTVDALGGLAKIFWTKGDFAAAEKLCRRSLEITLKLFGPVHINTASIINLLAWLLKKQGQMEMAYRLHKDAREIVEKLFGVGHWQVQVIDLNFAD